MTEKSTITKLIRILTAIGLIIPGVCKLLEEFAPGDEENVRSTTIDQGEKKTP
jgi:hypothetical protein